MLGLVLEGGGVKGAYQVGAVKALYEHGYKFDGFAGTSIGAINSALLIQDDWDVLIEMWNNMVVANILETDNVNFMRAFKGDFDKEVFADIGRIFSNLGDFITDSTNKSRKFLKKYINEDAIRNSSCDFGLVTFSLPDFEPRYFMKEDIPVGDLSDYVIASASYPVFKSQQLSGFEGKHFIDGGIYDNMPINLLAKKGYKDIIVIRTCKRRYLHKLVAKDLNLTYIVPSERLSTAMNFSKENIEHYIKIGYYDAKRMLLNLTSIHYCVETMEESEFYSFTEKISDEAIEEILNSLGKKVHNNKATNIESICDIIRAVLELDNKSSDFTVFTNFLELFATAFKVDRYQIYNLPDFYTKVMTTAYEKNKNYDDLVEMLKSQRSIKSSIKTIFVSLYNHYQFN